MPVPAIVERHETQAAFAIEGIKRVGLQVGVARRLAVAGHVVGELADVAALSHQIGVASLLSCRGEEACCGDIVGTVFDEDYLAVLRRILRYLGQRPVNVGLPDRHGMCTIVVDGVVR